VGTVTEISVARRRTGWDVAMGVLVIIAGLVILGNVVFATVVSVLFIGWTAIIGGVVALVGAFTRLGKGGFWPIALGGGLLLVLGLMLVRRPDIGALALTLLAGALFLTGGITRIVAAVENPGDRTMLLFSGIVSTVLGLILFFNIWEATLTLLGVLLGIQALTEGITLLLFGRLHADVRHDAPVGTAH
jgi:uncharacterized membrane protein HdeD (DUF308 family)